MSTDFQAMMGRAKPAERTVTICLRGDLVAELEDLERAYEAAARPAMTASKEDVDPAAGILEQIEAKRAEMLADTYTFRLRKLPPVQYRELRGQHPPRQDEAGDYNPMDLQLGFNRDTFFPVLIQRATFDPELTAEQWHELLGDSATEAAERRDRGEEPVEGLINYAQLLELSQAAYDVNEAGISVPFSPAVSLQNRSSGGE